MTYRVHVLLEGSEVPPFRASTVLVTNGDTHILVDPGASNNLRTVLEGLAQNGVAKEDVQVVVNTHLHYDHSENDGVFGGAGVVVGAGELAALQDVVADVSACTGLKPFELASGDRRDDWILDAVGDALKRRYEVGNGLYLNRIAAGLVRQLVFWVDRLEPGTSQVTRVEREHAIDEHVKVIATPGHTLGHVSVLVSGTENGDVYLVAGDALPTEKWMGREDASLPFCVDVGRFLATKKALEDVADVVIPGHGSMFRCRRRGTCA